MDRAGHYMEAERLLKATDKAIDDWAELPADNHIGKLNLEVIARLNLGRADVHAVLASCRGVEASVAFRNGNTSGNVTEQ